MKNGGSFPYSPHIKYHAESLIHQGSKAGKGSRLLRGAMAFYGKGAWKMTGKVGLHRS